LKFEAFKAFVTIFFCLNKFVSFSTNIFLVLD
jgi:hypothetical protein